MDKRKYKMIYKEDKKRCKDKMRFWAAYLLNRTINSVYYRIAKLIVILFLLTVIRVQ